MARDVHGLRKRKVDAQRLRKVGNLIPEALAVIDLNGAGKHNQKLALILLNKLHRASRIRVIDGKPALLLEEHEKRA